MRPRLLTALLFASFTAAAQQRDPSQYERVLLPIVSDSLIVGANGSAWSTSLWIRNTSSSPLDVFPMSNRGCCCSVGCFAAMRPAPALREGEIGYDNYTTGPAGFHRSAPNGAFLFVEKGRASDLQVSLHAADVIRRPPGLGTKLPAVPESRFHAGSAQILGVPVTDRARVMLRVYDRDSLDDVRVALRISQMVRDDQVSPRKELVNDVIRLRYDPSSEGCHYWFGCPDVKYRPAYAQIADLVAAYPQIAAVKQPHGILIELTSLTEGAAFWPMVSVTENETNLITIYTAE